MVGEEEEGMAGGERREEGGGGKEEKKKVVEIQHDNDVSVWTQIIKHLFPNESTLSKTNVYTSHVVYITLV